MDRIRYQAKDLDKIVSQANAGILYITNESSNEKSLLKVYQKKSRRELEFFENEANCFKSIHSKFVPTYLESLSFNDRLAIRLEDCEGQSLDRLDISSKLNFEEKMNLFLSIAKALQDIHRNFYIHQAINPSHIIWNRDKDQVKLIGFKFSSRSRRESTRLAKFKDLPEDLHFISPEQSGRLNRTIDLRSDIYSLGLVFYYLWYGKNAFEEQDPNKLIHLHLTAGIGFPNPANPYEAKMQEVIAHMCEKTPESRYNSCAGLIYDINLIARSFKRNFLEVFCVGIEDRPLSLKLSEKSYGRVKELSRLKLAYQNLYKNQKDFFLVSGGSGTGKTFLVSEMLADASSQETIFLSSKFDQFRGDSIGSCIHESLNNFFDYILSSEQEVLDEWSERLQKSLGLNAKLMADIIPPLQLILKEQPEPAAIGPNEAQKRFELLLLKIFRSFAFLDIPVVMFLDDLQWASERSIQFIKKIVEDPEVKNLFFIGCFRDDEIKSNSSLNSLISICQEDNHFSLQELPRHYIRDLLVDSFGDLHEISSLEKIVFEKTRGNPFEVKELLKMLERKELIRFDSSELCWKIDMYEIGNHEISDNVVGLLIGQMKELSQESQELLSICACVGNSFRLNQIVIFDYTSTEETRKILENFMDNQFVQKLDGPQQVYKFCHDRIQEAAYELLSDEERIKIHYEIARSWLSNSCESDSESKLDVIDVASHLYKAKSLCGPEMLQELVKLSWKACGLAIKNTAFGEALSWIESTISILENNRKLQFCVSFFEVYLKEATLLFITGNHKLSHSKALQMLKVFDSGEHQAQIYDRLVIQYTSEGNYSRAIESGRKALEKLGMELPLEISEQDVLLELSSLKQFLNSLPSKNFSQYSELKDSRMKLVMNILINMDSPCYFSKVELYSMVICKMIRISTEFGIVPESSKAFASYGIVLCAYGDYLEAKKFTLEGIAIGERFEHLGQICRACHTMANHVLFWSEPMHKGDLYYERGFNSGQAAGEYLWTGYIKLFHPFNLFFRGVEILDVLSEVNFGISFCNEHYNQISKDSLKGLKLICEKLQTKDGFDPSRKKEYIAHCKEQNSATALGMFFSVDIFVNILLGNLKEAKSNIDESKALLGYTFSTVTNVYDVFSESFLLLSDGSNIEEKSWNIIRENQKKLKLWASNSEQNFGSLFWLIESKMNEVRHSFWEAKACSERALEISQISGFVHIEAFCYENLARIWKKLKKQETSDAYLQRSIEAYKIWGAKSKVSQIYSQYELTDTQASYSDGITNDVEIDIYSVLEAYQVMGKKLVKQELIETMLQLLIRTGGATGGSIYLYNAKKQSIEQCRSFSIVEGSTEVLKRVVQYVWRTKETLSSQKMQAKRSTIFKDRSDMSTPSSLFSCEIPELGVLYLENFKISSVFTESRIKIIKMMLNQLKISLDNISLYEKLSKFNEELETKVSERTLDLTQSKEKMEAYNRALRQTQSELVDTARIAGRADVIANVLHNVGNASTLLMGHLEILESQIDYGGPHDFLFVLREKLGKPKQELMSFLDKDILGDSMPEVFEDLCGLSNEFKSKSMDTISVIKEKIELITKLIVSERTQTKSVKVSHQVSLKELCKEAIRIVEADRYCEVEWHWKSPDLVFIDAGKVKNIVINLLQNSVRACRSIDWKPKIFIGTSVFHGNLEIEITDNGVGMEKEVLSRVFDPGYSTKNCIGSGYGLHNSANIAMQLGGKLEAASDGVNLGASFILSIPVDKESLVLENS